MKLSNEKLINSASVLNKLMGLELPIKLSYALSKNIVKIDGELKAYNLEREKLIKKYGVKDEEGNLKEKEDGTIDLIDPVEFKREHVELLHFESEVDIYKIDLESISTDIKITPGELIALDYMFK